MEKVFYIDLKNTATKEELHKAIARELPVPDHYGNNLDALYDVLTELGKDWNVIFYNTTQATNNLDSQSDSEFAKYLNRLKKLCAHAEDECESLQIRFYP